VDAAYSAAVECFVREHERWNHWMVFFFGFIAAIFVAWQQLRPSLPLSVACYSASVISCLWTVAAINIRASATTWFEIARQLELGSIKVSFAEQQKHFQNFSRWEDYKLTLNIFAGQTWCSLTRILVLVATLVTIVLLVCAVGLSVGVFKV
jgi:hypothetical protein